MIADPRPAPADKEDARFVRSCASGFAVIKLFGGRDMVRAFIIRAYQRGFINAKTMHDLFALADRVFG